MADARVFETSLGGMTVHDFQSFLCTRTKIRVNFLSKVHSESIPPIIKLPKQVTA